MKVNHENLENAFDFFCNFGFIRSVKRKLCIELKFWLFKLRILINEQKSSLITIIR